MAATSLVTSGTSSASSILAELEVWGQKLGLERISALLDALGRPQESLPIVLVAGTNGKGSTSAMLASIAHASGVRTGLYTSPHLEVVEERVRINGRAIPEEDLGRALREIVATSRAHGFALPTYFEALTAAAFLHFARSSVELGVFEVGLGGRLDATNACSPILSVITPIGLDHQEHLGESLAEIASEKAGVARCGRPLLAWARGQPEVGNALRQAAESKKATLIRIDREVATKHRHIDGASSMVLDFPDQSLRIESSLLGAHQVENLSLAVAAAQRLGEFGVKADQTTVQQGVSRCRWPGRLECVTLDRSRWALLDGAHNAAGAAALCAYLDSVKQRFDLLYGSLKGKRAQVVLPLLAARAQNVTLTQAQTPRALEVVELASYLPNRSPKPRVQTKLAKALEAALEPEANLVICGSLYVVGEARRWLTSRYGKPLPAVQISTG